MEQRKLHTRGHLCFAEVDERYPEILHKPAPDSKYYKEQYRTAEVKQKVNKRGAFSVRGRAHGTYKRGYASTYISAEYYV